MDIQEIINYSKNKIEADDLAKQVRRRIKETTWEKQNQREGFSETFKPLISKFEKPGDSKKENIFTQNQEMLRNQLALTEGLRASQKAITDGFSQFERLADMKELPGLEDIEDEKEIEDIFEDVEENQEKEKETILFDLEKNLEESDLYVIEEKFGFPRPSKLIKYNHKDLAGILKDVKEKIKSLNGKIAGRSRKIDPSIGYLMDSVAFEEQRSSLLKYEKAIIDYLPSHKYHEGKGIKNSLLFSPQEMLKRFELLSGSLAGGNNGVLPEYIQIVHRLRDLGIVTNKQLNSLLRNYLSKGTYGSPTTPPFLQKII